MIHRGNKNMVRTFDPAILKGKKVLYICTKKKDYIRIRQEIKLVSDYADSVRVIGSDRDNYLLRVISVFGQILRSRRERYDILYVSFMSQMVIPFIRKRKNVLLIDDFFISIYDTLVNDRKIIKGPLKKLLYEIDRVTLAKSNLVITDTREHALYFVRKFNCPEERMRVLYLEADREIYYPHTVRRVDRWKGKYLVLYFGSILPLQGVEVILKAAAYLQKCPAIHFVIIGPVRKRKNIANVEYIDWLPQNTLADYIAQADLCLAGHFHKTIRKARRTIPGKAYIYRAMEKPMILGDNAANRERFAEEMEDVYFVPMGSARSLAEKIYDLYRREAGR